MIITVSSAIDKLVMVYHSLALELFPDAITACPLKIIMDCIEASYTIPDLHIYPIRKRELTRGRQSPECGINDNQTKDNSHYDVLARVNRS